MMRTTVRILNCAAIALALSAMLPVTHAASPTVVTLTQTGCQFLESEKGVDHGFAPGKAADCAAINEKTADARLGEAATLELKPGRYVFRVTNTDVPYELGFWLRGATLLQRATLPSVSGGGLVQGASRDYEIELTAGEYVYSCPLNPTPDYRLVVR